MDIFSPQTWNGYDSGGLIEQRLNGIRDPVRKCGIRFESCQFSAKIHAVMIPTNRDESLANRASRRNIVICFEPSFRPASGPAVRRPVVANRPR